MTEAVNPVTHVRAMKAIQTVEQLEQRLSEPADRVLEAMRRLSGDIILLGAGGKIGPSLARMARRASDLAGVKRRVIGVSRFSVPNEEARLQAQGVETIRCDLLDEAAVAQLPTAPNVIYLAGLKFGSTENVAGTWAMNTYLPGVVCRKYRSSRIVAFSTGAVYGLTALSGGGSRETDPPQPVGEYAMSCLGRERMFEYFSGAWAIPVALIRLFYACELRYGVLVDLARRRSHRPGDGPLQHHLARRQQRHDAAGLGAGDLAAVRHQRHRLRDSQHPRSVRSDRPVAGKKAELLRDRTRDELPGQRGESASVVRPAQGERRPTD